MAVAGAGKLKPEAVHVTAEVTLHIEDNNYFLSVKLKPQIDGLDRATAEDLVHKAHQVCPYSKATRNNIDVEIELA
jgi:Ohr subfamily peroxiredoxin